MRIQTKGKAEVSHLAEAADPQLAETEASWFMETEPLAQLVRKEAKLTKKKGNFTLVNLNTFTESL